MSQLRKRILIVDDESALCEVLAYDLEDIGYETISAHSGRDALALVRTCRPDAIVSDVRMPNGDGLELLDAVKAMNPRKPVVLFGGIFVASAGVLAKVDSTVAIRIRWGDGRVTDTTCIVRWRRSGVEAGFGAEFVHVSEAGRILLVEFVERLRHVEFIPRDKRTSDG